MDGDRSTAASAAANETRMNWYTCTRWQKSWQMNLFSAFSTRYPMSLTFYGKMIGILLFSLHATWPFERSDAEYFCPPVVTSEEIENVYPIFINCNHVVLILILHYWRAVLLLEVLMITSRTDYYKTGKRRNNLIIPFANPAFSTGEEHSTTGLSAFYTPATFQSFIVQALQLRHSIYIEGSSHLGERK